MCVRTNANPARLAVDCAWNALPSLNDLEIDLIDVALARPPFRRLDGRQEFVIRFKPGEGSQLCLIEIRRPTGPSGGPPPRRDGRPEEPPAAYC